MATIIRETTIPLPADAVWERLRDWRRLHELAVGFITATEVEGDERVVTFFNGATARELIVSVDDEQRRLVWTVTDSPLDYRHHNGAAQVLREGDGCRLVWTADFLPADHEELLGPLMQHGLEAIRQTLESTVPVTARAARW